MCLFNTVPVTIILLLSSYEINSATLLPQSDLTSDVLRCSKITVIPEKVSTIGQEFSQFASVKLSLSLNETVCFQLKEGDRTEDGTSSLLHTLQLTAVQQFYPITQRYQFAVPALRTDCICDCKGGMNHCDPATHVFANCNEKNVLCYRNYNANQPAAGCSAQALSDLCCTVSLRPYNDSRFWAIGIGHPTAFAHISSRKFSLMVDGRWRLIEQTALHLNLDGAQIKTPLTTDDRELFLQVNGNSLQHYLEPGMYFLNADDMRLRSGMPVNDMNESSTEKLGWYRLNEQDEFYIHKGDLKIKEAHFVKVLNCKKQTYITSYDLEQFVALGVEGAQEHFNLGKAVQDSFKWIASIETANLSLSRSIAVSHSDPSDIFFELFFNSSYNAIFIHNNSILGDFTGSILLDSNSNRVLFLMFTASSGVLLGRVYKSSNTSLNPEYSFSTFVDSSGTANVTTVIALPSITDGDRFVCISVDEAHTKAKCHWLNYTAESLPVDVEKPSWQKGVGHCPGCNSVFSDILFHLNPLNWFKGVSSVREFFFILMDAGFYVFLIIALFAIVRNYCYPLVRRCNPSFIQDHAKVTEQI